MAKTGKRKVRRKRPQKKRKRGQRGAALDIQKLIEKTGKEFHWPKTNYLGPGTQLQQRLKRGDRGVNRLDELAKIHDIDYSKAKSLKDKWKADDKMIRAIKTSQGRKPNKNGSSKPLCRQNANLSCNSVCFFIHLIKICCYN